MSETNEIQAENNYDSTNGYPQDNKPFASPAAQTFQATRYAYLSEVDLYFTALNSGPNSTGYPVTMQIRNCASNGEPGKTVYGETTDIYTDLRTGGQATPFIFKDPILLEPGKSYAFLLYTSAQDYQLAVSTNSKIALQDSEDSVYDNTSLNPNGKVHGSFYYSLDGVDWTKGDPTGQLDANAGGLCLKFDLKTDLFNSRTEYDLEVNPVDYFYNDINPQTPQYGNQRQNGLSYFTFSPEEFTPFNTSVDWLYSSDNGKHYHNLPLHTTIPVNIDGSDLRVKAILYGSPAFTPLVNRGSLHVATERTLCDSDNRYSSNNNGSSVDTDLQNYEFTTNRIGLDDRRNSGEYVSRVITFGDTANSQDSLFNQINASFDELNTGDEPVSIYVNLNPNNQPYSENSWKYHWIQLNGYDEYRQNGKDLLTALQANGNTFNDKVASEVKPSVDYLIVNPRTGLAYKPNDQGYASSHSSSLNSYTTHTYKEPVQYTYDGAWTTYHFHLSLKRLWNAANGNYHYKNATNDVAHEIQFKIVFHADSPYDHPKIRRFLATVGKDNELHQQLSIN